MKELLEQDAYQNGDALPKRFSDLLSGLCDILADVSNRVHAFTEAVVDLASKGEVQDVAIKVQTSRSEIDQKISAAVAGLESKLQLSQSLEQTRLSDLDKKISTLDTKMEEKLAQAVDALREDVVKNELLSSELRTQIMALQSTSKLTSTTINEMRETIPANPENRLQTLGKRIDRVEQTQRQFSTDFRTKEDETRKEFERVMDKYEDVRIELHNTILELEAKAKAMPTTYAGEDDQPKIVNGEVDISPLIRGIFRDSRRLDGFNEIIATTRLECEDIVNAMLELQSNMQKFNHNTHDLALEDGRIKALCLEKVGFLQASILSVDKQIGDIWLIMHQLAESSSHIASNVSSGFDQLQTILNSLSTRPLPLLADLSDLALECNTLRENIFEKRTQCEGEREQFHRMPLDDSRVANTIPDIRVKPLQRRILETQNQIVLPYEDVQQRVKETRKHAPGDSLVQRSLEELRVQFNSLTSDMGILQVQFEELNRGTNHKLEKKVDDTMLDRVFNKIHRMLGEHTTRLSALESSEETARLAEQEARDRQPKDPNGPSVRVSRRPRQGSPHLEVPGIGNLLKDRTRGSVPGWSGRSGGSVSEASRRLASSRLNTGS
jgi:hypothetical protein